MKGPESRQKGDFSYHYNRDEREASLPENIRERQHLKFWGRNRHLLIIFVDILVISLVFMFLLPYLLTGNRDLEAYSFSLNVVNFDGMILASLKGKAQSDEKQKPETADVTVTFRVLPSGRQVRIFDILSPEQENIIRGRIPFREEDERIIAEISINNEVLILEEKILRE
ncbi:hypothetical protein [Marispirochaeta sp.]|jgi:hypothetical protein|uniref:hypothetical protein n=1 Tax=Marispirochaeta sp. TaxID=2038653 RepID=UPI0029C672F5|nr:hypothetical protein [Marispirochaeta sp.]